jgi:hypothetical protein
MAGCKILKTTARNLCSGLSASKLPGTGKGCVYSSFFRFLYSIQKWGRRAAKNATDLSCNQNKKNGVFVLPVEKKVFSIQFSEFFLFLGVYFFDNKRIQSK